MAKTTSKMFKDQIISTVIEILIREASAKLASLAPWAFSGPLGFISNYFIKKAITWIVMETSLGVEILMIDFKTQREVESVIAIAKKFKVEGITKEQEVVLDKALEKASRKLITFT